MHQAEPELSDLPILAVDDEEANLLLLRRMLERAGYRRVVTTREPTAVPLLFVELAPALVLLDLHMPETDGFELMRRLGPVRRRAVPRPHRRRHRRDQAARARAGRARLPDQAAGRDRAAVAGAQPAAGAAAPETAARAHRAARGQGRRAHGRPRDLARHETLERLALAGEFRDDDAQGAARRDSGRTVSPPLTDGRRPGPRVHAPADRPVPLRCTTSARSASRTPILLKPGRLHRRRVRES